MGTGISFGVKLISTDFLLQHDIKWRSHPNQTELNQHCLDFLAFETFYYSYNSSNDYYTWEADRQEVLRGLIDDLTVHLSAAEMHRFKVMSEYRSKNFKGDQDAGEGSCPKCKKPLTKSEAHFLWGRLSDDYDGTCVSCLESAQKEAHQALEKANQQAKLGDQLWQQLWQWFNPQPCDQDDLCVSLWVKVHKEKLATFMIEKQWCNQAELNQLFLQFIEKAISGHAHGAGQQDELWESRRQDSLALVLIALDRHLNEREKARFKVMSEYQEEPIEVAHSPCTQCGVSLTPLDIAMSLQDFRDELCASCYFFV